MRMVSDAGVILTKNRIIDTVYELFGELSSFCVQHLAEHSSELPSEITQLSPKISRGENYLGLPWVVLDYPRCFRGEDIFSVRSFFWWGNFFSTSLLLSGKYLSYSPQERLRGKGWSVCVHTDPWQHHFGEDNFQPLDVVLPGNLPHSRQFQKFARKLPLSAWTEADLFLKEGFTAVMPSASRG